jgi:DNA-binding NarL/FixJ family response regulator
MRRTLSHIQHAAITEKCMATKGVLIVDDNPLVRSSLRHLFECHSKFEVSGEAEDGQDAIDKAEGLRPDLIVMDLSMPNMTD